MLRLCIALALAGAAHADLPADPFQRAATKALRGDYGKLKPWQRNGYASGLTAGVTVQGLAWVTSYYPQEGFRRGKSTRSGVGVSERSAAVSRATWAQRRGMYVWTAAYGIRVVEDSGATSNDRVARHKGATTWLDYWFASPHNRNPVTPFAMWRARADRAAEPRQAPGACGGGLWHQAPAAGGRAVVRQADRRALALGGPR